MDCIGLIFHRWRTAGGFASNVSKENVVPLNVILDGGQGGRETGTVTLVGLSAL